MKKGFLFKAVSFGLIVLMGMSAAGCAAKLSETDISYAGPMVDNLLAGIKDSNYTEFSKDFTDTMKGALNQDNFDALVTMLQTKIGDYQSRSFSGASATTQNNTNIMVVVYKAKYTKETGDVVITVSFSDNNGIKQIAGFYLNSPNLQKQ